MFLRRKSSMKRFLLLFSICVELALSTTSCMPKMIFSSPRAYDESSDVQDFTLKAGKNEISGLLLIRHEEDGSVRAVATAYFGMTLFDMTVSEDSSAMNSCASFLDRKSVAAFLESRLRSDIVRIGKEKAEGGAR